MMIGWGGLGTFIVFLILIWALVFIDLILLGIFLFKKIQKENKLETEQKK